MSSTSRLGVVDIVVFSIVLIFSAAIGIYFAIIGRGKRTTGEFLVAGRQMGAFPVSMSLLASFMSAITLLGTPSEIYQFGTMYWYIVISYLCTMIISNYVYIPVFYELNLTSSYEYLGARFHKAAQIMSAMSFIFQMTIYMGIVLYAPSLALNAVTGLNVWVSVFTVGPIAIAYTTVGGMKAVMWTDVFQIFIMFAGLIAVLIKGVVIHGGIENIISRVSEAGRLEYNNFSFDPTQRHTFWTGVIGGTVMWSAIYAVNQTMVQRALTAKSLKTARTSYFLNIPGLTAILSISAACGLIVVATYKDCDPQSSGRISAADQLLPLFVMDYLSYLPGVAGLFVAALFSGAMSTISSGLNSLAAVTLHDIIMIRNPELNDETASKITKGLALGYGILCLFFAYISSMMGPILGAALGLFGMLASPVLGVMTLGMIFPFANTKGAISGHIISQICVFYIGFGYYIYGVKPPKLPVSTKTCNETISNWTIPIVNTSSILGTDDHQEYIPSIHKMSYIWYSLVGWSVVVIVGVAVSLATGCNKEKRTKANLISPVVRSLWARIPRNSRFSIHGFDPKNTFNADKIPEINAKARRLSKKRDSIQVSMFPKEKNADPAEHVNNNLEYIPEQGVTTSL